MKNFDLVPNAENLMESTRSIGYSLSTAVADLLDNSIAAHARTIRISTPIPSCEKMLILDDGTGMDSEELLNAMRYGCRNVNDTREKGDLGRFGLGLKMASLSQCRSLTVVSKKFGRISGARWDLDYIASNRGQWLIQIFDEREDMRDIPWLDELSGQDSGTLIVWEKLDLMLMGVREKEADGDWRTRNGIIAELKQHLSLVFHRYLDEPESPLIIEFNGNPLEAADPFLKNKSQMPYEEDSYKIAGLTVRVQPYILPHPNKLTFEERQLAGDLQKDQGFYIYRNKRLIIWGSWLRLSRKHSLSKLARIRVDIPASPELDRKWSLDVKKSSARVPEELKDALKTVVEKMSGRSRNVWTNRVRYQQTQNPLWKRVIKPDNEISYQINEEYPPIKKLIEQNSSLKAVFQLISLKLPINEIYSDLSDEKIIISDEKILSDVEQMMNNMGLI